MTKSNLTTATPNIFILFHLIVTKNKNLKTETKINKLNKTKCVLFSAGKVKVRFSFITLKSPLDYFWKCVFNYLHTQCW